MDYLAKGIHRQCVHRPQNCVDEVFGRGLLQWQIRRVLRLVSIASAMDNGTADSLSKTAIFCS